MEELRTHSRHPSTTTPCCRNCGQQGHTRSSCQQLRDVVLVGGNMDRLGAGAAFQPAPPGPDTQ